MSIIRNFIHILKTIFLPLYERVTQESIRQDFSQLGLTFPPKVHTYTKLDELIMLYSLSAKCPKNGFIIEIGSYLGASTYFLVAGSAKNNVHTFCVDTWNNETMPDGERDTFQDFRSNTQPISRYITTIRSKSEEVDRTKLPPCFDLAFIDGDHSYEAVKNDYLFVDGLTTSGSIVAFHDSLAFDSVTEVIGEALASKRWKIGGNLRNLFWIIKK